MTLQNSVEIWEMYLCGTIHNVIAKTIDFSP